MVSKIAEHAHPLVDKRVFMNFQRQQPGNPANVTLFSMKFLMDFTYCKSYL